LRCGSRPFLKALVKPKLDSASLKRAQALVALTDIVGEAGDLFEAAKNAKAAAQELRGFRGPVKKRSGRSTVGAKPPPSYMCVWTSTVCCHALSWSVWLAWSISISIANWMAPSKRFLQSSGNVTQIRRERYSRSDNGVKCGRHLDAP
jgi:hypothetical protein